MNKILMGSTYFFSCYEDFKEQFGWTEKSAEELLALNTPSSEELHQNYHIHKINFHFW